MTRGVAKIQARIFHDVIQVLSAFDDTARLEAAEGGWLIQSRTVSNDAHVEVRISDEVFEATDFPTGGVGLDFETLPDLVSLFAVDDTERVRFSSESKVVVSGPTLRVSTPEFENVKYKPLLESNPSALSDAVADCISHGLKVEVPGSDDELIASVFDNFLGEVEGMRTVEFELKQTGQFRLSCVGDNDSFEYSSTGSAHPIGDPSDQEHMEEIDVIRISDGFGDRDHLLSRIYSSITKFTEMDQIAIFRDTDGDQYLWFQTTFADGACQATYTILDDDRKSGLL